MVVIDLGIIGKFRTELSEISKVHATRKGNTTRITVDTKYGKFEYYSMADSGSELEYELNYAYIEFMYVKKQYTEAVYLKEHQSAGIRRMTKY